MSRIFFTALLAVSALAVHCQTINGDWQGTLAVESLEIPVVFHIRDSAGQLSATFDSPKQQAFNLPCSKVYIAADSLVVVMDILKGRYAGRLSADKATVAGTWYQGLASLPLTLTKTSNNIILKELKRPQTPKAPYPYYTEETDYYNKDQTVHFAGTFTRPAAKAGLPLKKYPAVLLITGSGPQDRDETIIGHKSFAVIADYLSRNGFAVLRVDDRGVGKTSGDFSAATSADFANDAEAGLDYLKQRKDVDVGRIGLLGHSEGGMIAPVVASRRKDVKFMVLLAGPGIPIADLMPAQIAAVDAAAGYPEGAVDADRQLFKLVAAEVVKTGNEDSAGAAGLRVAEKWAATTDTGILRTLHLSTIANRKQYVEGQASVLTSPWFRYFLAFDPQPYLKKTISKVLALNGSKDIQVIAGPNLEGIKASLQKSGSPKYDIIERPGLNHLFQHCKTCTAEEYGELEETFDTATLQLIGNWLKTAVK